MGRSKSRKRKSRGLLFAILILVILVVAFFVGRNIWMESASDAYMPDSTEYINFTVPSGASTTTIANMLEDQGIIKSASKFKALAKKYDYDGKFQAGDFTLSPSMDAKSLMDALCFGKYATNTFTIPEGLSVEETAAKLEKDGIIASKDAFLDEVANGSFDNLCVDKLAIKTGNLRLEGMLMPNTYEVYQTDDEHAIIQTMLNQFDKVFTEEAYEVCKSKGYDPYAVLCVASIVEKEARVAEDRPLIASVIYNRLNMGMALQMDSTINYALGTDKENITYADLEVDSPYNTYKNVGLPPTPICSPGESAINAALYPADTNYIYFVVSEKLDGSHVFSSDYNQFLKDKEAYKRALGN